LELGSYSMNIMKQLTSALPYANRESIAKREKYSATQGFVLKKKTIGLFTVFQCLRIKRTMK
jgi:hypothetical protein